MKIEIPDDWFISMTGCHPDTSVKDAAIAWARMATDKRLFHCCIGEFVMHQILNDKNDAPN